jgi:hypothetical protein
MSTIGMHQLSWLAYATRLKNEVGAHGCGDPR